MVIRSLPSKPVPNLETVKKRSGARYRILIRSCLALILIVPSTKILAQQASQSGYDIRQIERRFDADPFQQGASPSSVRAPKPHYSSNTAGDTKPLFVLTQVKILGATAVSNERLVSAYKPFLDKKVSQADLATIATAISDIYRAAGFHLSRAIVPKQDIRNGTVRVQVIEGAIVDVALKGEDAEQFGVRGLLAPILTEEPSRLSTLERQLMLINSRPGVRIQDTTLDEIGDGTGRFRLTLSIKTWHVYASLGVDNLGSSAVGPWQTYAAVAFNSYRRPGDSLALNISTTPSDPRELAFGRISYDTPVGMDGATVGVSGIYSEVRPGDYRRAFGDITRTEAIELRGSITPIQSQKSTLVLTAALSASNVTEKDVLGLIYDDHIRTANLTADYKLQDSLGGTNFLALTWRQGLAFAGASHTNDQVSRYGAAPTFSVMNVWFTRYQTLADSWSLKISAAGQAASGPVYLSQQFYLGGAAFGRGYGAAEISGDNGMAGSFELRFDQKVASRYLSGYQLYGFVDTGVAWNDGFRYSDGLSLTSAGGGVRFFLPNDLQADIGAAVPLSYRAPENFARDVRFIFSLTSAIKLCPNRAATRCL